MNLIIIFHDSNLLKRVCIYTVADSVLLKDFQSSYIITSYIKPNLIDNTNEKRLRNGKMSLHNIRLPD